jgi:hypothetical protein
MVVSKKWVEAIHNRSCDGCKYYQRCYLDFISTWDSICHKQDYELADKVVNEIGFVDYCLGLDRGDSFWFPLHLRLLLWVKTLVSCTRILGYKAYFSLERAWVCLRIRLDMIQHSHVVRMEYYREHWDLLVQIIVMYSLIIFLSMVFLYYLSTCGCWR